MRVLLADKLASFVSGRLQDLGAEVINEPGVTGVAIAAVLLSGFASHPSELTDAAASSVPAVDEATPIVKSATPPAASSGRRHVDTLSVRSQPKK